MILKQINKHVLASGIHNGDIIPVGGSAFFNDNMNYKIEADIGEFKDFFDKVEKNAKRNIEKKTFNEFLLSYETDFPPDIFTHMDIFQFGYNKTYPNASKNIENRDKFFNQNNIIKLSDSLRNETFMCSEIAILAQAYLQYIGVDSKYFGGSIIYDEESDDIPHSFIIFSHNGKHFIWDPSNPTLGQGDNRYPSVLSIELTEKQFKLFNSKLLMQQKAGTPDSTLFFEAKNILTKISWYYGYGHGGMMMGRNQILSKNKKANNTIVPSKYSRDDR